MKHCVGVLRSVGWNEQKHCLAGLATEGCSSSDSQLPKDWKRLAGEL